MAKVKLLTGFWVCIFLTGFVADKHVSVNEPLDLSKVRFYYDWPILSVVFDNTFLQPQRPGNYQYYYPEGEISARVSFDKYGNKAGLWTLYYKNGTTMCSACFEPDNRIRNYKDYYKSGKLRMEIAEGKLLMYHGESHYYVLDPVNRTSSDSVTCFSLHSIDGTWFSYPEKVKGLQVITMKNGVNNGPSIQYDSTGQKTVECLYKDAQVVGECIYYK